MINNSNIIRRASVAAIAETTGGIGYKGQLPWEKLALDFAFLKWVTTGQFRINEDKCELERFETNEPPTVVFGNKTWISIGKRPLPKRNNVVITSRPEANTDKVRFISNLNELREELVYFLGGSGVYRVAMDQVQ